jgi:Zn-dependent protease
MFHFRVFGIPVGVHWSFVLIGILVIDSLPLELVASFIIGVFIAVLAHELGHALTARAFGAKSIKITLFGLGGLTQYPTSTRLTPGKQFLIAASGSAVGMTLGGIVFLMRNASFVHRLPQALWALGAGVVIAGLMWGALNWLPILPLDGGNMARYALAVFIPRHALRIAKVLTVVAAAAVIFLAIKVWDNTFGVIAFQGLQMADAEAARQQPADAGAPPGPQQPTIDPGSLLSIFDDDPKS